MIQHLGLGSEWLWCGLWVSQTLTTDNMSSLLVE